MAMPNFILIGAQKAGTTAIAHYLEQHPQVFMSPSKEPGFFAFEGNLPNFKGPGDQSLYSKIITNLEDYSKLFETATNEIAIGEATTWYLYSQHAADNIKYHTPDAKLIAILRNPIDRAYSAYMHAVRDNREMLPFEEALEAEHQRITAGWEYLWHYQAIGRYAEQLERYYALFPAEQIQIYLYDDLQSKPERLVHDIFQFLNVDPGFQPPVFTRLNISGKKKSKAIDQLLNDKNPLKQALKPLLPIRFRKQLADQVRTFNYQKSECPDKIRIRLHNQLKDDILRTQDLIGRDLSHWLRY